MQEAVCGVVHGGAESDQEGGFFVIFFIFFEKSLILFWGFWNRFFVWSVKWWVLVFKA